VRVVKNGMSNDVGRNIIPMLN